MSNAQLDYILQSFTVYVDGYGKAGSGEKCNLPKFKKKMEDFRGGGMLAARKVALGYEAFEFEAEFSALDPQVMTLGQLFNGGKSFSVEGYLTGDQDNAWRVVVQMRGEISELDPGTHEPGKKAMLKMKVALDAVKLVIADKMIYDIDIQVGKYDGAAGNVGNRIRAALGY